MRFENYSIKFTGTGVQVFDITAKRFVPNDLNMLNKAVARLPQSVFPYERGNMTLRELTTVIKVYGETTDTE